MPGLIASCHLTIPGVEMPEATVFVLAVIVSLTGRWLLFARLERLGDCLGVSGAP
jgi:hypothetical protein